MRFLGLHAKLGRFSRLGQALCLALALGGCGEGFDPGSEVKTLRVLGVHKDKPYPRPGEDVTLTLLWTDGSSDPRPDPVQVTWLMGGTEEAPTPPCVNPQGDLYYGCFAGFGAGVHSGNTFQFGVPSDIVSSRPPPVRGQPRYGLIYAFFAVCAGQLGIEPTSQEGALPLVCRNSQGVKLGPDDFVVGYTSLYVFDEQADETVQNQTPVVMSGLEVAGHTLSSDCVGIACVGPEQPISFDDTDPIDCATDEDRARCFPSCDDDGDPSCPKIPFRPLLEPDIAEPDDVSAKYYGRAVGEQMWINYYANRGGLKSEVRLLNDATTGWNADYGTAFYAPKEPGLVTIWSVVHDNRGGTNWVRARLRIE